tara:strand:+ start:12 stop:125 length:114 start_codon:yes stop_codon:yes gene_type:complete
MKHKVIKNLINPKKRRKRRRRRTEKVNKRIKNEFYVN